MAIRDLVSFVRESNRIEGIIREPHQMEVEVTRDFLGLNSLTVPSLVTLVQTLQPGARLRAAVGLDVRVGNHLPPEGGPHIRKLLQSFLEAMPNYTPHSAHVAYETLHPFTDGNGRSGRAIWAWQMVRAGSEIPLGFLHQFYYQTLAASR